MHLTTTNLAYHGGDAAKKLARELTEQAGGPRTADVAFDTLLARARTSAATRRKK